MRIAFNLREYMDVFALTYAGFESQRAASLHVHVEWSVMRGTEGIVILSSLSYGYLEENDSGGPTQSKKS